jgi:DNA polymerase-4
MDLDEFIAAVEVLRRPELAGAPVVVGGDGDPTKRGVVSTANYEARRFGVRSGMPLRTALKRCPEAVFLPVDPPAYEEASREVMDTLRVFPAVIRVLGWDEAFLGVETRDPEALARDVQRAVLARTRLWCSIGVGDTTLRAKLATGFAKPRGVFRLTEENWMEVVGALPTAELFGIGRKTAAKLEAVGIRTVEELANANEERLAARFGPRTGPWLRAVARGEGERVVTDEPHVPAAATAGSGRSRRTDRPRRDPDPDRGSARELAGELAGGDRPAVRVVVKVRFCPFFTSTHGVRLPAATLEAAAIERGALEALGRFGLDRPVRLLGVRVELADPEPG